jgi:two-component system NtrC family sensor kinase
MTHKNSSVKQPNRVPLISPQEQSTSEQPDDLLQVIARLEQQVTERGQTIVALQQYTDRLRVLHQIDQAILAVQSPEDIAQTALKLILQLVPCQWTSVSLFDFEVGEVVLLAANLGVTPYEKLDKITPLAHVGNIEELRQGQPLVEDISTLSHPSEIDQQLLAVGMCSRIQAPLISRDDLIGSLTLAADTPGIFSVEHSAIAEEMATQIALALDNAQLYAETQRRSKGLAALNKAGRVMASTLELETVLEQIMAEVRVLLEAEGASILLHDPASDELFFATVVAPDANILTGMRLPLTKGIAGWVMQEQQPVLVDDVQHDPRFYDRIDKASGLVTHSLLAVPLIYKDKSIGVIEVVNTAGQKFRQHDLKMLEALTGSAAIAIANARLYKDLQNRIKALEDTQQQLIQSEKMAALGRLVASITHEVNNPLQSVQTCLTLTREEMAEKQRPEKIDRYLEIVETEIERVSTIIGRMRDFYRPTANQGMQLINLPEVLESVLELSGKQLQHGDILIDRQWLPDLPEIEANPDHLKQVFLNLLLNAIDAMPQGGTLHLKTKKGYIQTHPSQPSQPAIQLEFKDTGQGMTAETMSHLFEPFFTTKPNGSGLGLCISYGIIEAHHGQIRVISQPEIGTTFYIHLPLKQPEQALS